VVISGSISHHSKDGASGGGEALGRAPFTVEANRCRFFRGRWDHSY